MKNPGNALSNRDFFKALVTAVLFLALSAILLIAGFVAHNLPAMEKQASVEPLDFRGVDLRMALGMGNAEKEALVLKGLEDGNAVLVKTGISVNARDFPILEFHIEGRHPGLKVAFYWVRKDDPRKTHFAMLPWNGDAPMAYRLESHEDWGGQIVEFGLSINGDLREGALVIEELSLQPLRMETLLFVVWSEWTAFEGWQQYSINAYIGASKKALISPVVTATAWAGLAAIGFVFWRSFRVVGRGKHPLQNAPGNSHAMAVIVMLLLVPWLALDGKWQFNLLRQHEETWHLFAGKSHHEQHLAAEDAQIYQFARKIQGYLQAYPPGRLFLLRQQWRDYVRLKMMYYLLPQNIYNYGAVPNSKLVDKGDYILALRPLKWMKYDAEHEVLRWGKGNTLHVTLLYRGSMGSLYRVRD